MCGIAGIVRMDGGMDVPRGAIRAMTDAITHRGPDEEGFLEFPGLALGARRLSIIGLADGHQPMANEDGSVHAVFNGELFDFPERKRALEGRGHRFKTSCDTELLPHLWEDEREAMFAGLRGQFALAIFDARQRRLVLARDRFGICPLYWTVQRHAGGKFLIFASEIKALLSSGLMTARPDVRGIDHTFTFFALPGPITCFEGVNALRPGHFLSINLGVADAAAKIVIRPYWEIDFPDRGSEQPCDNASISTYDDLLRKAVDRRLRADVPVVAYLSGGVDSSIVLAMAREVRGGATPPSFTLQIKAPGLDETAKARQVADSLGAEPTVVPCGMNEILAAYPRLIAAAECPVSDTCCSALLLLAQEVHRQGFKVALTGEGSDETLAGYPWFKINRLMTPFDAAGFATGNLLRRAVLAALGLPRNARSFDRRIYDAIGGSNAWLGLYGLVSAGKARVYGPRLKPLLGSYVAFEDLGLNLERARRWHPLNRSLYLGQRIHLPGLLLSIAGDRVAMHSSVETRYPFLDEDLITFVQQIDPAWKLRRFQDKYILRRAAERHLPRAIAWRPKTMFRAPWDVASPRAAGGYIQALLTPKALEATGYFDTRAVEGHLASLSLGNQGKARRTLLEQTLAGVAMTQFWHHIFIADLGAPVERFHPPVLPA
jgi:asparagine synthase (glutamine-hydrolysing)